jgi:hypothetical protein
MQLTLWMKPESMTWHYTVAESSKELTLWMKPRLFGTAEMRTETDCQQCLLKQTLLWMKPRILRTRVRWERHWAEIPYSVQSWELA